MRTIVSAGLLMLIAGFTDLGCTTRLDNLDSVNSPLIPEIRVMDADDEIDSLISQFREGEMNRTIAVRNQLKQIAAQSDAYRTSVIEKLKKVVSSVQGKSSEDWNCWEGSVDTLGSLKATESIDLLIESLDRTNGFVDLDLLGYPAARAIREIGEPALRSLKDALLSSQQKSSSVRGLAAKLIGQIGGRKELPFLKEVLSSEKDKPVKAELIITISTIEKDAKE